MAPCLWRGTKFNEIFFGTFELITRCLFSMKPAALLLSAPVVWFTSDSIRGSLVLQIFIEHVARDITDIEYLSVSTTII